MKVLIDTCIWSTLLRRCGAKQSVHHGVVEELVTTGHVVMIGPIRQELLSGLRNHEQFQRLATRLEAFPDLALLSNDYVRAAEMSNLCRSHGVQGSSTDFLICAVAERESLSIYTTDKDFTYFAKCLPLSLFTWQ